MNSLKDFKQINSNPFNIFNDVRYEKSRLKLF